MKTILITGVSGFVGSKLAEILLDAGEYRIIGVSRTEKGFLNNEVLKHPRFVLLNVDLAQGISKDISACDAEAVVHLASRQPSGPHLKWEDFYSGNVETTRSVLSFVRDKKIGSFIYLSTTSAVQPRDYYGITKYTAERLIEIELKNSKTKGIVLRCPSLVGRNHKGGLIHTYYELARQGKDIEIFSEGRRLRNTLHVDDLVQAIRKVLASAGQLGSFELFQLGSKDSLTMYDIARLIKEKTDSTSLLKPVAKSISGDADVLLDLSHAAASWGFSSMSVEETIERYLGEMNA